MDKLRDKKEVWLTVFLMGKVMMLKQKKLPSTLVHGTDYADTSTLEETSLLMLLPNFPNYPGNIKRDLFDFFTMGMLTSEIVRKISR
jgi:hypothetical protein